MKNLNNYILEKFKIKKGIDNFAYIKEWLKKCERVIVSYLDKKKQYYDGEYEVKYSDNRLNIIFNDPIPYDTIASFGVDLYKKLSYEKLIDVKIAEDVKCINNKWTIIFIINDESFE